MNTKVLVILSLFVGIGAALHAVIPGIFLGMKPSMDLIMMFLGILLFPSKKNALLLGVATGIIAGLTTAFPGGLIPNIIDKIITACIFYLLYTLFKKYIKNAITSAIATSVGTIISGTIFLSSALVIVGLPGGAAFSSLFVAVVLPTVLVNSICMFIIYPIVQTIIKRMNVVVQA